MRYRLVLTDDQGIVVASWPIESDLNCAELEDDNDLTTLDAFGEEVQCEIALHEEQNPTTCSQCGSLLVNGTCASPSCPLNATTTPNEHAF